MFLKKKEESFVPLQSRQTDSSVKGRDSGVM